MGDKSTAKLGGSRLARRPSFVVLGVFEGEYHGQRHNGDRRVSTPTDS